MSKNAPSKLKSEVAHLRKDWFKAIASGDMSLIQSFPRELIPSFDHQALRVAAEYGHLDVVRWLLPQSNPAAGGGWSLRLAARNGHEDVLKELLPLMTHRSWVFEALCEACIHGREQVANLLASATDVHHHHARPLVFAAQQGHWGMVEKLWVKIPEKAAHRVAFELWKVALNQSNEVWLDWAWAHGANQIHVYGAKAAEVWNQLWIHRDPQTPQKGSAKASLIWMMNHQIDLKKMWHASAFQPFQEWMMEVYAEMERVLLEAEVSCHDRSMPSQFHENASSSKTPQEDPDSKTVESFRTNVRPRL